MDCITRPSRAVLVKSSGLHLVRGCLGEQSPAIGPRPHSRLSRHPSSQNDAWRTAGRCVQQPSGNGHWCTLRLPTSTRNPDGNVGSQLKGGRTPWSDTAAWCRCHMTTTRRWCKGADFSVSEKTLIRARWQGPSSVFSPRKRFDTFARRRNSCFRRFLTALPLVSRSFRHSSSTSISMR